MDCYSLRDGFSVITCGEDHVLRDEFVIHDGELGQFDLVHPRHGVVTSPPVELNVIRSVAVWKEAQRKDRKLVQ